MSTSPNSRNGHELAAYQDQPLPRPIRKQHRAKDDRGLPPDDDLVNLAKTYMQSQHKHWPKLVQAGLLPAASNTVIASMVEDFKERHRTGNVNPKQFEDIRKLCPKLAGDYNRYSCDNSNPNSILDQMSNALDKARQENRFIPWQYVFADYSVSGLNPERQGYSSYKALLKREDHFIETTYVDDFTRPSRDEIEWWRLAHMSRRLRKRMIGASDGFDLSSDSAESMISIYGLVSRLFIKGLQQKVRRGMKGAARRGTCLGKLSLGFTKRVHRNADGKVVYDVDGLPQFEPCIDPGTVESRKLLYDLFVTRRWSKRRIAKHFSALKVDGWDGWTAGGIHKLLKSATSVGVFIWNRTRMEYDHEEEKWTVVKNDRKDWVVYYNKDLAIIPFSMFAETRRLLSSMRRASPVTGRRMTRNQKSATTLFSGTLHCQFCEKELTLCRSTNKYKVLGCLNGTAGAHECKLTTTKSTRIIEKSLLGYLQDRLLTESAVTDFIAKANAHLKVLSSKPREDTRPLKDSVQKNEAAIARLFQRIEISNNEHHVQASEARIATLQKEVNSDKIRLREIEARNVKPPPPLNLESIKTMLDDLRGLFNQEIPAAAEAIRDLTGNITIRQEQAPGQKRGATWIASFQPDFVAWIAKQARNWDCPDSVTLEYLSSRKWITIPTVEVPINHIPKYEEIAPTVKELHDSRVSISVISRSLKETWLTVRQALEFAETGKRPTWDRQGKKTGTGPRRRKMPDVAEVLRLRNEERLSFQKIAQQLGVRVDAVTDAYDKGHPEAIKTALDQGKRPSRGHFTHLPPGVIAKIRQRLQQGTTLSQIAREAGCSIQTVSRVKKQEQLAA